MEVAGIARKSSIESEPRTLSYTQIDVAREAALYVVHTRSREEAWQIFTEGLEPVETMEAEKESSLREYLDEEHDEHSCTSSRPIMKQRSIKDVLTAPF